LRAVEQGEVALLRDLAYWTVDGDGAIIQHADLRNKKKDSTKEYHPSKLSKTGLENIRFQHLLG
jgi:hypothetical protein